jgi:hypothetical protein
MRTLVIVIVKIAFQAFDQIRHRRIVSDIDILIFKGSPKALDEDIIQSTSLPIHTNTNFCFNKARSKLVGCELRILISVEDFWLTLSQG